MFADGYTPDEVKTLSPLPLNIRNGLYAVAFFAILSLVTAIGLFGFITFRLIKLKLQRDEDVGINQFVLLIYNLLLADIQQSLAFALSANWISQDAIVVGTGQCWAQGWFVSTGDVAGGLWTLAIAIHTGMAILFGYKLPNKAFCAFVVAIWTFVFVLAIIPPILYPKDVYVRSGVWCWIDAKYPELRLWCHYLWILVSMFGTVIVYSSLGIALRRRAMVAGANPALHGTASAANIRRAARYLFIYPIIYVICALPLAAGRMAAMSGRTVSPIYYLIAGSLMGSCGWIDALLYAFTRRRLLFVSAGLKDERTKSRNDPTECSRMESRHSNDYSSMRNLNTKHTSSDEELSSDLAATGGVTQETTIHITSQLREDLEDIQLEEMGRRKHFGYSDSHRNLRPGSAGWKPA